MEKNLTGDLLLIKREGSVGTITLNRPEKRNSLTVEMLLGLIGKLEEWGGGDDVRAVVITGAGDKAFCAGFDVRAIPTGANMEAAESFKSGNPVEKTMETLKNYPYPTIAMLNGYATGAGFNLAMCCDIRIAAEDARMGIPPAKLGLVYHPEGMKQVVEAIGMARAREVFFTGRLYGPDDVREMGLTHRMVPRDALEKTTYELAEEIAGNAPIALKGLKKILNMLSDAIALDEMQNAEATRLMAEAFGSEDLIEGQRAFMEKRKPAFKGK